MRLTIEQLQFLSQPDAAVLLTDAEQVDPSSPAAVERFRKQHQLDRELASAALHITQARIKARKKLPDHADALFADVEAVEQADSLNVARHKARRFASLQADVPIFDLCCGMGVSALGLSDACEPARVTAVDREASRAWMAHKLAGCQTQCNDVATFELPQEAVFHIDPSRRQAGRRSYSLEDYDPAPEIWATLLKQCPHGAFKLSPGVNLEELDRLKQHMLADAIPQSCELEFISESGRLVQSVLWCGKLADLASRRATCIDDQGQAQTLIGAPDVDSDLAMASAGYHAVKEPVGRYLLAIDPAVERAGLISTLGDQVDATLLHPGLGLLICDQTPACHAMITPFVWLDVLPFRPRKIKRWLQDHNAGHIEVKTRGGVTDPNPLQVAWSRPQGDPFTLFILRFDKRVAVLVTQRL